MPFPRTFTLVSLYILFFGVMALGVITAGSAWSFNHGVLFSLAGLLMIFFAPVAVLPRIWVYLGFGFFLLLGLPFLPDQFFPQLAWRRDLKEAGLEVSNQIAMQSRHAFEMSVVFAFTLLVGLWLQTLRISSDGLRRVVLTFSVGIAFYAVLAFLLREQPTDVGSTSHYGFFPNRNHSATLLAMGAITALGVLMQGIRSRRAWVIALSLISFLICAWAIFAWSVSRAGVVLLVFGVVIWLIAVGPNYLRGHTRKALLVLGVAILGGFFVLNSQVKERIAQTNEKVNWLDLEEKGEGRWLGGLGIDFRLPTWSDTLGMIGDRPWTGFGAGQFSYVFPQYRNLTTVANETRHLHPESDWLWLAAEVGIPATLLLAAFVVIAVVDTWKGLSHGRSRAIRASCLAAALVMLLHSLFDVPGHRVSLAWISAFLLSLARRPSFIEKFSISSPSFRLGGILVFAGGTFLLVDGRWNAPAPLTTTKARSDSEVRRLYQNDLEAGPEDVVSALDSSKDPLLRALAILEKSQVYHPLDSYLHHSEGIIALGFSGRADQVNRAFEIERLLEPKQPAVPMRQAIAWLPIDAQKGEELIEEAQLRARSLDSKAIPAPSGSIDWNSYVESWVAELKKRSEGQGVSY